MADGITARLDLARAIAREASERLLAFARDRLEIGVKGTQDYVTAADRAIEQLVRDSVAQHLPGDAVLGEEGGGGDAERLWVVDPIDGTINFIRGLPSYAVSIAYVEAGTLELGVVQIPPLGEMFVARRGHGAFCNDRPIRVSDCTSLAAARVAAGYAQRGSKSAHLRFLGKLLHAGTDVLKVNSAAVCLAMVAAGRIDGYYERELMAWDVLAGQLLVREAGGWTNDFGAHGYAQKDYTIACGPALAAELRAAAVV
jgi:myo-inositol-1(or 4)-monophosphatase